MKFWRDDPVTKIPSVSLTLLLISGFCVLVVGAAHTLGYVQTASIFPEMFYSCIALYFGRRINIGGKAFSADKAEDIKNKLE